MTSNTTEQRPGQERILYSQQYDSEYLEAPHLTGDTTLEISEIIKRGQRTCKKDGKKIDKPILMFKGKKRGLVLNKTNARIIALVHGGDLAKWVGKTITLFPTTCNAFGNSNTPCIRVKVAASSGGEY